VALFGVIIVFSSTFLYFVVGIRRHHKKFTFAISSLWWVSCIIRTRMTVEVVDSKVLC